ncbi:P-loop containing nucleoside triphosphate hydrolase protein [Phyllosticta citricarpa]|uniref:P-loop containing nucleoside triphosphate hydrolase protein n=1 Tax=Phyllosticta citricarpa TaxID=55181 RepID=A0ABR1MG50_9PEZI
MVKSGSLANPVILEKIDKLFSCNIGNYIDLPQIVVIGDQSSGKSSVLESLTDLPFPKDSGLCTRFATQITFRRDAVQRISVEIVPGKDCDPEHAEKVRSWKEDIKRLDQATFESIMHEVHAQMGLSKESGTKLKDGQKIFTEDVLSIHVAGPDQEHFSVIDVPGVFKNPQAPVTELDMKMVERMVLEYMKNSRSVLLAVIPANVDIATQSILQTAKSVDPEGKRTLGVLTKPDLVDKGAESSVIDLVEGRKHKLSLGWSILKNPGQAQAGDRSTNRRKLEEEFFAATAPWNKLPMYKVGVDALRIRLQEILEAHIRHEFPKVKVELQKRLKVCKAELDSLGPRRATVEEQRAFLIDMATQFQYVAQAAVNATYNGDDLFSKYPNLKLATTVRNRNDAFSKNFGDYGHTYSFSLDPADESERTNPPQNPTASNGNGPFHAPPLPVTNGFGSGGLFNSATKPQASTNGATSLAPTKPFVFGSSEKLKLCPTRQHKTPDEIDDLLYEKQELGWPKPTRIAEWMKNIYKSSRGFEMGTFNPSVLATTMKAQSENWSALVFGYISDIIAVTHDFVKTLLTVVCPDAKLRGNLLAALMDQLAERYKKALWQAEFILEVERFGVPETGNHYFNDNLEKRRSKRMRMTVADKAIQMSPQFGNSSTPGSGDKVVRLDDLGKSHPMSNTDHIVQDLQDILAAYYKVALKRIVDNVCMQAASYHLVSGPSTPLKLFSPALVGRLTAGELEEIAGEDPSQKRRREQLQKEYEDLEKGKKILLQATA